VAFLKFSRDKRGVESFSLVHAIANRRGKVRPRILYWFRTPPDIKVGRQPFDPDIRRALEKQNPDITFDWRAIEETPIPSADADKWRERRRIERAAKHAARAEQESEAADGEGETESEDRAPAAPAETDVVAAPDPGSEPAPVVAAAPLREGPARAGDPNRKRRRRRRGGGGRGAGTPASAVPVPPPPSSEPSGD
jgi:hypothetical protein